MLVLEEYNKDGSKKLIAIQPSQLFEVTQKWDSKEEECWIKYWNGNELRSKVVIGTVESISMAEENARCRR